MRAVIVASTLSTAAAAIGGWTSEAGDAQRSSRVAYLPPSTSLSTPPLFVRYHSLGVHTVSVSRAWPSLPLVTTDNATVVVTSSRNELITLPVPESVAQDADWTPSWVFTKSGGLLTYPALAATPCLTADGWAYYVVKQGSHLWGVNLVTKEPAFWAPMNLTKAAMEGGANPNVTRPFTNWYAELAIGCYDNAIWIPDHSQHGVLSVDMLSGKPAYTEFDVKSVARMIGSVGTNARSGSAVAFTEFNSGNKGLVSLYRDHVNDKLHCTWHTSGSTLDVAACRTTVTSFRGMSTQFLHPISVYFKSEADYCIIGTSWNAKGIILSAAATGSHGPCGGSATGWPLDGILIRNEFTELPSWVSAPATLLESTVSVRLYFVAQIRVGTGIAPACSLISIRADATGTYDHTFEGFIMHNATCNSGPVVVENAWGRGSSAVAVVTKDGQLRMFPAYGFAATGANYSINAHSMLPANVGTSTLAALGNYITVTSAGTVMWMARGAMSPHHLYLIAVVNAVSPPVPVQPTPSGPSGAGGASGVTAGSVAVGIATTLGVLGVAAAGIVVLAPTASFTVPGISQPVVPADVIRSGVISTWGGLMSGSAWITSKVAGMGQSRDGSQRAVYSMTTSLSSSSSSYGSGFDTQPEGFNAAAASTSTGFDRAGYSGIA